MLNHFKRITPDQALAQHTRDLQASAAAAAEERAVRDREQLLLRGPGRPKKELSVDDVLAAAAAAIATHSEDGESDEQPAKRGKYTNWWTSPLIHDILAAYQTQQHSGERAVAYLQRTYPRLTTEPHGRFDALAPSTVRSWHDSDGTLLPKFKAVLDTGPSAAPRGSGFLSMFTEHPDIEQAVIQVLSTMRDKGTVVNVAIIRFVMRTIILVRAPASEMLKENALSKSFISKWAHQKLQWTWRVRTTAASKLPEDWRARGVEMAKRIACNMQIHKVPPFLIVNVDQTGVHLCPSDHRTYAESGSKSVAVVGGGRAPDYCLRCFLHGW
jgi:hypothetical protein